MVPERAVTQTADYSHRSPVQKLGIEPGQRVEVAGDLDALAGLDPELLDGAAVAVVGGLGHGSLRHHYADSRTSAGRRGSGLRRAQVVRAPRLE